MVIDETITALLAQRDMVGYSFPVYMEFAAATADEPKHDVLIIPKGGLYFAFLLDLLGSVEADFMAHLHNNGVVSPIQLSAAYDDIVARRGAAVRSKGTSFSDALTKLAEAYGRWPDDDDE